MEATRTGRKARAFFAAHRDALTIVAFCLSACEVFFVYRNFRIPVHDLEHIAVPLFGSFIAVFVALLACVAMLAIDVLFGKRVEGGRCLAIAALCASSAPLIHLVAGSIFHQTWVFVPCMILASGGCACFLPEMARRLAASGVACTVRCNIACCIVLLVVAPLARLVPLEVFIAAMSATPLLLLAYFRLSEQSAASVCAKSVPGQKVPRILLLTILVASMMEGVVSAVDNVRMTPDTKLVVFSLAFIAAAVLMFTVLLHLRGSFNSALFRVCFPIMTGGIALFVLEGELALELGSLVFLIGRQLFAATILALVVYLVRYLDSDYYLLSLGVVIGAMLGSFIGLILFFWQGQAQVSSILPPAFVVFLLFCVFVTTMYLMNASNLKTRWGMTAIDDSDEKAGMTFEHSCLIVAEQWHLTKRESEIVMLLARGKDKQAIAEKLFISEGTVKVHARNIYQKLGIHSKQELIRLVESTEESIRE
ncbi:helix-turn-helix domain-containing protein [Gordonibacter pamelaeae]|uniref:helix-turn-helix domain-containing protein n=1 Tax=Gordonibacter pamelaeae TaxID=471189 RepID=UPI002430B932|nr:helix-turn-helix transcriptional regulator [Gordonibacter pamelaeae]